MSSESRGKIWASCASLRRALLGALAALVLAFAALYPYLEATGSCGEPGCPHFSQAHVPASSELPAGMVVALVRAIPAAPAFAGRIRRRFASDRKPAEVYLSPELEPPRT
ncbi:hypothetical protein GBA63_19370 [Rubrobacter tropicus]|uniref:Uncharacterized protein n=1 Tax=Rubrobacter tropicus TaxID=2653851 RepID=A0A6G8QDP3_9ACTN|nr:hypothetical protein [Rubrobacter tropicus]QIN84562.1 hypothetical protein GBA63_19370 [Rubrobacter tropicus]